MRIAVTGAGGGLGRAFISSVGAEHEVFPFTRQQLDVGAFDDSVRKALVPLKPDVIMHFAAMTGVDACEEDRTRAFESNTIGSGHVADAARDAGALLVAVSTDYVFDGEKGEPYDERDKPNPISVYGRTKYFGEEIALALADRCLVVRTAWVYGAGNDFASKAVKRLAVGEEVGAIADQVGSPTHVAHLGQRLLPLAMSGLGGVVHLAGAEAASWHDFLVRAKEIGDLPGEFLPQKAEELDRPATRPANSALTSVILEDQVPPMPPLDEGIRKVLSDVGA